MSPASVFGSRFLSHREPAWHKLGLVVEEPLSAQEAFQRMGPYEVELVKVRGNVPIGPLPYKVIVRKPTADDPQHRTFGLVSLDYTLIKPEEFVQIWDDSVANPEGQWHPVETIGALGHGETMFISTKMPSYDVAGDEIDNYLLAVSPMTGGDAAEVRVTPVRVVCQNTLIASAHMASETYRIWHTEGAKAKLAGWLSEIYNRALERSQALQEAFSILAAHRVVGPEDERVFRAAYPDPRRPRLDAPEEIVKARQEGYEYSMVRQQAKRDAAGQLFQGRGQGSSSPAYAGTAWGLYNACCELEDYRRGRGPESIARNALFGGRAKAKAAAFEACLEISTN